MRVQTQGVCRSCGAAILWVETDSGKLMPVDLTPVEQGNLFVWQQEDGTWRCSVVEPSWGKRRHRPHFATCPDAESWRSR